MAGIKIVLVEDDWIIAKEITYTLQDLGFEVIGNFDTGDEALKQIKVLQPDIVLLDIDLSSEITGIDVAKKLKEEQNIPFIFLTALADRETIDKAKLVEPHAYLVKPVNRDSIYSTIEITLHKSVRKEGNIPSIPPIQENLSIDDGIFVKTNKRLEKIMLKDVLFIEAYDIYAMLHTASGKHLLNTSLKAVEERFPTSKFIRTHRSFIINLDEIDAIEENDIIIKETRIPIGKTYREKLMTRVSLF